MCGGQPYYPQPTIAAGEPNPSAPAPMPTFGNLMAPCERIRRQAMILAVVVFLLGFAIGRVTFRDR